MSSHKKARIFLLVPHTGNGGAEKVITLLSQYLNPIKYEIHLGLLADALNISSIIPPHVSIHFLRSRRVRGATIQLLRLIWKIQPDILFSGIFHLNFLVLLLKLFFPKKTLVVIRQNGMASLSLRHDKTPFYARTFYRYLYPCSDAILCQTTAMACDIKHTFNISGRKIVVLPNPIQNYDIPAGYKQINASQIQKRLNLLAVGRLTFEKGFDLLLNAFPHVLDKHRDVHLTILGAGPQLDTLQDICHKLQISCNVSFAGYVNRPATYYLQTTLFVLPSRHEGMPNALLEAAVAGLPIAALPAGAGIVDLLSKQKGIWLAKNVSSSALSEILCTALTGLTPLQRFHHGFVEPYKLQNAICSYESFFDAMLTGK